MPTVPTAQNDVGLASVTSAKLQAGDFSGNAADAAARGTQTLAGQSDGLLDQMAEQQRMVDVATAKNGVDQLLTHAQAVNHGPNGFFTLGGMNAYNGLPAATKDIQDYSDSISKNMNPRQQAMYQNMAGFRTRIINGQMNDFANSNLKTANISTAQSLRATASDAAVTGQNDPAVLASNLAIVNQELQDEGHLSNWTPEELALNTKTAISKIHYNIAESKRQDDPVSAQGWANANKKDMTASDYDAFSKDNFTAIDNRDTIVQAQNIMKAYHLGVTPQTVAATSPSPQASSGLTAPAQSGAPSAITSTDIPASTATGPSYAQAPKTPPLPQSGGSLAERFTAIVMHMESKGNDLNNHGGLLTSTAGAQGAMQVMPGTQKSPGFGVKPAQNNSPQEIDREGHDYALAMLKHYGGDAAKAFAAYNWGVGRVDTAIAKLGDNWFSAASKNSETKNYVNNGMAMLGDTSHLPTTAMTYGTSRDDIGSLMNMTDYIKDPVKQRAVQEEIKREIGMDDEERSRKQDDAKDKAYQIANSFGDNFKTMNQLGPIADQLSPEVKSSFIQKAQNNSTPPEIKANGPTATKLNMMMNDDNQHAAFIKNDLRIDAPFITPAELAKFTEAQQALNNEPLGAHATNISTIGKFVRSRMASIGYDPRKIYNPQQQTTEDVKAYTGITNSMQTLLSGLTKDQRVATPAEQKEAWDASIQEHIKTTPGMFYSTKSYVDHAESPDDIGKFRATNYLALKGLPNPTSAQLQQTYNKYKGKQGYW